MAFNDTLFQLGMDLTRSSTAQKEDLYASAPGAQEDWNSAVTLSEGACKAGQRLIIDLVGAKRIETAKSTERALRQALELAKGKILSIDVRRTEKGRCLSGSATLSDGHVSIEAWPESGYVAIDVFGNGATRPDLALTALIDAFDAREAMIKKQRTAADVARFKRFSQPLPSVAVRKPEAGRGVEKQVRARRAA